jgi:hypothetical protein
VYFEALPHASEQRDAELATEMFAKFVEAEQQAAASVFAVVERGVIER